MADDCSGCDAMADSLELFFNLKLLTQKPIFITADISSGLNSPADS